MFGVTSKNEPVKGEFATKVKASVSAMKNQSARRSYGCQSTANKKYTVTVKG